MIKITASQYGAVVASILGFAVLTGCKKPTTDIGLEFAQEDLLSLNQTDTLALSFETVREDSLETSHLSTAVLGNMEHPFFGMHQGSFAAQLRLSAPDIDFGPNPVVDSIYLSLHYSGDRYGQLSPQNIHVEALVDTLSLDSDYYSNASFATMEVNLADPAFQPVVLNPGEILYFNGDNVAPEVRVYLDNAFGQSLLDADSSVYDSNQDWREYFPGLLIAPDPNGPGQGAVGIDVTTGLSRMRMHYHSDTDSAATYDFIINALSPRTNGTRLSKPWMNPTSPRWTAPCYPESSPVPGSKPAFNSPGSPLGRMNATTIARYTRPNCGCLWTPNTTTRATSSRQICSSFQKMKPEKLCRRQTKHPSGSP
jgi:hypothetical protein